MRSYINVYYFNDGNNFENNINNINNIIKLSHAFVCPEVMVLTIALISMYGRKINKIVL